MKPKTNKKDEVMQFNKSVITAKHIRGNRWDVIQADGCTTVVVVSHLLKKQAEDIARVINEAVGKVNAILARG